MTRMTVRHINLSKLANKLWASMSKRWAELYEVQPQDPSDVVERLKQERLKMTDWDFRVRYARWL